MKKILFAAYSLDIGGIEKALVTLANNLQNKGYDITIVLEKKKGIFLEKIDKNIKIIEYSPDESKNVLKRKIINFCKRIKFMLKYKNKFDFSASFATYSLASSFVSRVASKNSCLWGHADYLTLFDNNVEEMKKFFEQRKYDKFKHIVFVSSEGKESFLKIFPSMASKTIVCNNMINDEEIKKMSEEKIKKEELERLLIEKDKLKNLRAMEKNEIESTKNENTNFEKNENLVTFINVGRHDEKQKKLSRIIEASKMLKQEGFKFRVLFIGEGQDTLSYKNLVEEYKLKENCLFLGKKQNPYPYYKIADCVILTSDYEGYPVVFLESFILNKPIITTKVSDYQEVEGKYGYITGKNSRDVYEAMKLFIQNGFKIKKEFDAKKYNEDILKKLEKII